MQAGVIDRELRPQDTLTAAARRLALAALPLRRRRREVVRASRKHPAAEAPAVEPEALSDVQASLWRV